jgi:[calcium/calmodulin-dependent protein kinase] kinase
MIKVPKLAETFGSHTGFKSLLDRARAKEDQTLVSGKDSEKRPTTNQTFSDIAANLIGETKDVGKDLHERGSSAFSNLVQKAIEKKDDYTAGKSVQRS